MNDRSDVRKGEAKAVLQFVGGLGGPFGESEGAVNEGESDGVPLLRDTGSFDHKRSIGYSELLEDREDDFGRQQWPGSK